MTASEMQFWRDPRPADLGATPEAFLARLPAPVAIHVSGRDPARRRVVVTLLHGNEPSGLRACHAWLRGSPRPVTDVLVVLPGVRAASTTPLFSHRTAVGERDLNRCFRVPFDGREGRLAQAILHEIRRRPCEALIDLHNNTGHNPPYAVGTMIDAPRLAIAALFAGRYVHSNLRIGSLTEALDADTTAVTIECGLAGDPRADEVALRGLDLFVAGEPGQWAGGAGVEVLESPVRVCLAPGASLAFADQALPAADLTLAADVERHNFETLPAGTCIGWIGPRGGWPLTARGADDREMSAELFAIRGTELHTRQPLIPIMITTHPTIAASDCLFYVVHRAARSG